MTDKTLEERVRELEGWVEVLKEMSDRHLELLKKMTDAMVKITDKLDGELTRSRRGANE